MPNNFVTKQNVFFLCTAANVVDDEWDAKSNFAL